MCRKVSLILFQHQLKVGSSTEALAARLKTLSLKNLMRVMSAAREVSDPGGRLFQPEAGRVRPQIFFRIHNSKEVSKSFEETEGLKVGYSFSHWEVLRTLFFRSVCNLAWFVGLVRTA